MNNSTLDILKQIIDNQMKMPVNRVWAYNASQPMPQDAGLFIVLQYREKIPYSNNSKVVATESGMQEVQTCNMSEYILISCISQNTEARDRVHDVLFALSSTYSQQLQEANNLHISTTNNIEDNSFLEASSMINRFDIECTVLRTYEKIQDIQYYDKFPNTNKLEVNYLIKD